MSRSPHDDQPLNLECHGSLVRRLAAEVLGFRGDHEDLAQEAMLAAVRSNAVNTVPRPALRAWFARTLRRMANARRTQSAGRAYRESSYALERETAADPAAHAVHSETVRRVSDAVLSLNEPYLTTVLLSYYEDQSPRQIAASQDVPLATVRSRLQRAREQLRARLQAEYGGSDRALGLALLPLVPKHMRGTSIAPAAGSLSAVPLTLGAFGMKAKLGAGLVALVGLAWFAARQDAIDPGSPGPAEPLATRGAALQQAAPSVPEQPQRQAPQAARTALGSQATRPADAPQAAPKSGLFGRVTFEDEPVAGVTVAVRKPQMALIKDAQGNRRPALPRPLAVEAIFAAQLGHPTFRPVPLEHPKDTAPPGELLIVPERAGDPVASTDSDGRFHFAELPDAAFVLTLRHDGKNLALRDLPRLPVPGSGPEPAMDLGTLEIQQAAQIKGRIKVEDALRLDGHRASLRGWDSSTIHTLADGTFQIDCVPPGDYLLSLRPHQGLIPTDTHTRYLRLQPGESRLATLRLPTVPCSVASVSVTCNGEPFADQTVIFSEPRLAQPIHLHLDGDGRGVATLPARTALRCVARVDRNHLSLGPDLVLEEGASDVALQLRAGRVELHIPSAEFPAPEVAELSFEIDSPDYTAVRFDLFNSPRAQGVELDPSGRATLLVPAWTRLDPVLRYQDRVWVHLETDRAEFPPGPSNFHIHVDPLTSGMRITGGRDPDATAKRPSPKQYRVALGWSSITSGEDQVLYQNIHPMEFAGTKEPIQTIEFDLVPSGQREFTVSLQRRSGHGGSTFRSWPLQLEVVENETVVASLGEPGAELSNER